MIEDITGGAAGGFDGKLKEWPEIPLEIKKYSSNSKNNFIIELTTKLYSNSDFINTSKTDDIIARECIQRAKVLADLLEDFFE